MRYEAFTRNCVQLFLDEPNTRTLRAVTVQLTALAAAAASTPYRHVPLDDLYMPDPSVTRRDEIERALTEVLGISNDDVWEVAGHLDLMHWTLERLRRHIVDDQPETVEYLLTFAALTLSLVSPCRHLPRRADPDVVWFAGSMGGGVK